MICELMKDESFLAQKAEPATAQDQEVAQNLLDTLIAHESECVGMAANMIGVNKAIIAFLNGTEYMVMYNPRILRAQGAYEAQEGCLSLAGKRTANRYETIKVQYENAKFQTRIATFTGFTAQIIQHEVDHCEGKII